MKLLSTQRLYHNRLIKDDPDFQRLIAILIVLSVFIWNNRQTILRLIDNINQAFMWVQAIQQTQHYWHYQYKILVNPFPYGPG